MKRASQPPSYDYRAYLQDAERAEWDALVAEAATLDARRRDISARLDAMRTRSWNRRRTHLRKQLGVACPRCVEQRPWCHPSLLQPGQICRVDRYQDPRVPQDDSPQEQSV